MTCDNCSEPATFRAEETACMRDHCPEHFGTCAACQDEMAAEVRA
jgi:hypothetical protein